MRTIGDPELLARAITEGAAREAAAIEAAAAKEAARLLEAAAAEAAAAGREALAAARAEGARRRAALLASAPAETARRRAAALERLLEKIKAEALRLAEAAASGPAGRPALAALAAEAAAGVGGREAVLSSAPGSGLASLREEIRRLAGPAAPELRFEETEGLGPGAAARSADGRRRWDNTLAARLERMWPGLRREAAAALAAGREP